jgi:hypothetical protein
LVGEVLLRVSSVHSMILMVGSSMFEIRIDGNKASSLSIRTAHNAPKSNYRNLTAHVQGQVPNLIDDHTGSR